MSVFTAWEASQRYPSGMGPLRAGSYRIVPGLHYGTPKEVWGFQSTRGRGTPLQIAREFLRANEELLGLEGIRGRLKTAAIKRSLGADHAILQQHHAGSRVHRAYVSVHIGRADRRVYLVKNRAIPKSQLPKPTRPKFSRKEAVERVIDWIEATRRHCRSLGEERIWYPWEDTLRLSFKVRVEVKPPGRQREEWIVYIDAKDAEILDGWDNLASARARVFDPNPVIALGDHTLLLDDDGAPVEVPVEAYREVELPDLDGGGRLDGRYVSTEPTGPRRALSEDGDFLYDARRIPFEEVMAYFHIDRAVRYFESLGFVGEAAIFHELPIQVNADRSQSDQSAYSPGRKQLIFGRGEVNDAEDAETIIHELGHAVQDAICPDFGQSPQSAAMGEGFGDYLALSFFADRPPAYAKCVMVWDGITWNENDPPCVRIHGHGLTMESFDGEATEHENGRIWAETLLDVKDALGRKKADTLILEGHFQLDGFTTFARGARALVDADRNLYSGRHERRLRRIFEFRGIGPV